MGVTVGSGILEGHYTANLSAAMLVISGSIPVHAKGGPVLDEVGAFIGITVRFAGVGNAQAIVAPAARVDALVARLDTAVREQAWPVQGMTESWTASVAVAEALDFDLGTATAAASAPGGQRPDHAVASPDSLQLDGGTKSDTGWPATTFATPNLEWLRTAELRDFTGSSIDRVRIVGVRKSRYRNSFTSDRTRCLLVKDPKTGFVSSDDYGDFHFAVGARGNDENLMILAEAIRKYRDFDVRINFKVHRFYADHPDLKAGFVQSIVWTDRNGRTVEYLTFQIY